MSTNAAFVLIIYFFCELESRYRWNAISTDQGSHLCRLDVETTGQTLEDLDLLFEKENSWWIGPKSARLAKEISRERARQRQELIEAGTTALDASKAGIAGARPLDGAHIEHRDEKASTGSMQE